MIIIRYEIPAFSLVRVDFCVESGIVLGVSLDVDFVYESIVLRTRSCF